MPYATSPADVRESLCCVPKRGSGRILPGSPRFLLALPNAAWFGRSIPGPNAGRPGPHRRDPDGRKLAGTGAASLDGPCRFWALGACPVMVKRKRAGVFYWLARFLDGFFAKRAQ